MVLTVTLMVHPGSRSRWVLTFASHIAGGAIGGLLTAGAIAWIVQIAGVGRYAAPGATTILIVSLLFDARLLGTRVPSLGRQVPQRWREYFTPPTASFLYGVGLGMGVTTRVYFASTYAVFLAAGLLLTVSGAIIVGAAYGAARSSAAWIAYRPETVDALRAALARRDQWRGLVRGANVVAQVVLISFVIGLS